MKHLHAFIAASLTLFLAAAVLMGCQSEEAQSVTCPFTKLTWDSSVDDMTTAEGTDYTTYDSTYNGTTYVYPKSYLGLDGTVKYMFDGNNKLMCTAWAYSTDSEKDLKHTYDKLHQQVEDTYGESGYDAGNVTNTGDVWYLDGGDIILSAVTTDAQKVLQYAYQNPEASDTEAKE